MTKKTILKFATVFILTISLKFVSAQSGLTAFVSQEGNLSFKLTKSAFYIYTSQKGKITGYGALGDGSISYDFKGRVDKIGALLISYDFSGRIDAIGTTKISYDFSGRVDQIGTTKINYDFSGNVDNLGGQRISYNLNKKVDKIGSATISYNFSGNVDKIDDDESLIVYIPKLASEE